MSRSAAPPETLAIGIIAGEIALAAAGAAPPEWIKVTPRGRQTCRDGRTFDFDPEGLVAKFQAERVHVAIDTDHSIPLRGARGETPNIVGYAGELQARDDGLYAKPEWNDAGRAVLSARTHRYVSPSVNLDGSGRTVWLHSIALVPAPALSMPALFHLSEFPMKEIAKALGLPAAADEQACLAALAGRAELKPLAVALGLPEAADGPACLAAIAALKSGGNGLVAELQTNLAAVTTQLTALQKQTRDKDVADLLEGALKDRKIVPAQRESYVAMCATDAGLAGVRTMLAATPANLQASGLEGQRIESGDAELDPAMLAAEARTLMDERAKAGTPLNISDAMTIVVGKKAKG